MEWLSASVSWVGRGPSAFQFELLFMAVKKFAAPLCICIFALGGATIGAITGAIKGQTTETGLLRGFGVGAVAGAITGVQLMELIANGEPFSKVALICSLINGKIVMEWVSTMETSLREISEIFEVHTSRGLSQDKIKELPVFYCPLFLGATSTTSLCAICLQDYEDGECMRLLPSCKHHFHIHCIDEWLTRQGTCPICRKEV